jgi:hypothetical protein
VVPTVPVVPARRDGGRRVAAPGGQSATAAGGRAVPVVGRGALVPVVTLSRDPRVRSGRNGIDAFVLCVSI